MAIKKKAQPKAGSVVRGGEYSSRVISHPSSGIKLWTLLVVIGVTFIATMPALRNDFINFDDPQYVTENPVIQKLNSENVKQFFTHQFVGNYQPLVMLSYALQYQFFGKHAGGFHFISLLFHLLNTALVFVIVYLLLRNNTSAVITALLFGIHPLHVESVAWIASQKDVLYTFFFLGAIYFYIRHKKYEKRIRLKAEPNELRQKLYSNINFLTSNFLFILSVLCKAQAVVLPMVLILIDYWQWKRITWKMVIKKAPYFIIAISFGLLAVMMQKKAGAVQDYGYFTIWQRLLFSSFGFINYLWQTILPIKLSLFYSYPETHDKINSNWVYASPFIITALAVLVFFLRKHSPIIVFGVLFFCLNIALVIQLIPVGDAIHADRYTYISLIGFFIIAGYYFGNEFDLNKNKRAYLILSATAYFIVLGVLTFKRSLQWKDSISIYTASLKHDSAPIMYCNRGAEYFKLGKYKEAWDDFDKAVKVRARFPNAFKNRGLAYDKLGDPEKAIADFTSAMTYNRKDVSLLLFRGNDYKALNRFDEAITDFNTVIQMDSSNSEAYYSRAEAHGRSGKLSEALADINKVLELKPDLDAAYNNRGIVLSMMANYSAAIIDFTKAIELNPQFWNSYYNRAVAYQNIHDYMNAYNDAITAKKNDYPVTDTFLNELETGMNIKTANTQRRGSN